MFKSLKRVNIVSGHYGSGKTEFSINLAMYYNSLGFNTVLIDIDIVNPFFRSAMSKKIIEEKGVRLITSSFNAYSDLPALPGNIDSLLNDKNIKLVIDLGGDPVGARAISRYKSSIPVEDTDMIFVVNSKRRETNNLEKSLFYMDSIEISSRQKITKLINTTHLFDETVIEDIIEGEKLSLDISKKRNIKFIGNVIKREQIKDYSLLKKDFFLIDIYNKKPWEL